VFTEEPSQQQLTPLPEEYAEPPEPRPREGVQPPAQNLWRTAWLDVGLGFGVWGVSVVLLVFGPVVFALPYIIYRIAKFGPPTAEALSADKTLVFLSVLAILPVHLLTFVLLWVVITYGGRRPFWQNIDFGWPKNLSPMVTTLASVLVATLLFLLAVGITSLYGERKTDLDFMIESSIYTRLTVALAAAATAPLVEELIYRGLLYRVLEKAGGMAVAIPIVSLLFAGIHVLQYRNNKAVILVITLLSFTLTIVRAVTGKVLPAFIILFVFNGIQSVLIVLGGFIDKDIFK